MSTGMENGKDGDAASRMGMLQVNDLQYKLEPDLSVATQRTYTTQFFQNTIYDWSQTAIAVLNSGAYYIDPRRSFLTFDVILPRLTTGFPASASRRKFFQALYLGKHGSVLNFIDQVVVTTRSGDELSRVNDFGTMMNELVPWMFGREYLETIGEGFGYGSYIGSDNDVKLAMQPDGATAWPPEYSDNFRHKFSIPMYLLSPIFNYGRLLPAMLMSGLRIEIKWKEISACGVQFLENIPRELPLGGDDSPMRNLTLDRVPLAKKATTTTDFNPDKTGATTWVASYGASSTWGLAGGGDVTYSSSTRLVTFTADMHLLAKENEGFERGTRAPLAVGEGLELYETTGGCTHKFKVLQIVSDTTLLVEPLDEQEVFVLFADAGIAGNAAAAGQVITFPAATPLRGVTTSVVLNNIRYFGRTTGALEFTADYPTPPGAVAILPLTDGFFRSSVPSFTSNQADAVRGTVRFQVVPTAVTYQRNFNGTWNGGQEVLPYVAMQNYSISGIELSLACTQLSDAVQRTLNEYSAQNGLEIVFADYDRTSGPINANAESTGVYLEVRKSASRALMAFARVCPAPTATTRPFVDTFASLYGSSWSSYQWQLGSLYFPQQKVAANDSVPLLQKDGTLALAYNHTADAFDRYHPKASSTAVSLRGAKTEWNVINRFPIPSTQEHAVDSLLAPSFGYGQWGSFVNGATTLACTLERSSLFDLSGIPINNSRVLSLRGDFNGHATIPGILYIFLKYVKVVRVFLLNAEVEQ